MSTREVPGEDAAADGHVHLWHAEVTVPLFSEPGDEDRGDPDPVKHIGWLREKWRIALEQRHLWEPAMAYRDACLRYREDGDAAALQSAEVAALSALLAYAAECEASQAGGSEQ